jgi:hypothetical protein
VIAPAGFIGLRALPSKIVFIAVFVGGLFRGTLAISC